MRINYANKYAPTSEYSPCRITCARGLLSPFPSRSESGVPIHTKQISGKIHTEQKIPVQVIRILFKLMRFLIDLNRIRIASTEISCSAYISPEIWLTSQTSFPCTSHLRLVNLYFFPILSNDPLM